MNSTTKKIKPKKYISPVPIPPGDTIKEIINELDMSQKELAARMGISEKHLSQVIKGTVEISRALADKLEVVLGIDALFWLNLENQYREALKRITPPSASEEETVIAKSIPYSELAKNKFVDETRKLSEKIVNLRSFFGVTNLISIPKVNAAYRKANICKENEYALITWIRIAEIQSKNIETQRFNRKKLIKALPRIRQLTQFEPEVFYKELVNLLADCGIALVIANHLSGTGVHGVTFLNNKKNKLIVQLSVRRKYADTFWFTLFHEISHIVTDETEEFSYLACDEETESSMDRIARDILIPEERYRDFVNRYNYNNYSEIEKFAKEIEIHPCIVIGRLQYDHYLSYSTFSDLRPKFKIG